MSILLIIALTLSCFTGIVYWATSSTKVKVLVELRKLKMSKATKYTSNVTVIENRGRYSGNSAFYLFF